MAPQTSPLNEGGPSLEEESPQEPLVVEEGEEEAHLLHFNNSKHDSSKPQIYESHIIENEGEEALPGKVISSSSENSMSSSDPSDSSNSSTRSPDVDGGWAWVVFVAAFLQFCVSSGMYYSFSVFFVQFLQTFQESRAKTGWVYSTNSAMHMFSGPLGGWVITRWGPRSAVMLGGILAGLGNILTAFAPNLDVIFVTHGLINAVGTSLNFSGWVVGLSRFWERRHALAVGIAMSGSGCGIFFLGPLMEHIVIEFGWRGAMLICAGLSFNFCVFGATIYGRIKPPPRPVFHHDEEKVIIVVEEMGEPSNRPQSYFEAVEKSMSENGDTQISTFRESAKDEKTQLEPHLVSPLIVTQSMWSLSQIHEKDKDRHRRIRGWVSSAKSFMSNKSDSEHIEHQNEGSASDSGSLRQLFCSPTFWLLEVSCFLSFMSTTTIYAVFLDWTEWSGLSAAFSQALSGSGIGDLLGRMLAGVLMGRGLPPLIVFCAIQLLLSVTIGGAALSSTSSQLVVAMVGVGTACGLQSVLYALMPSQLSSGVGMARVLGYLLLVTGAGALSGPPIAGALVDFTDSYAPVLIMCSVAPAAAAVLNFTAHFTARRNKASEAFEDLSASESTEEG